MNFWKKSFVAWPNEHAFDKIEVYKKKYIKYARYNNKTTNKIVSVKFRLTLKNLQFSIFFSIDAHFIYGLTYAETKCLKLIVAYNFHFRPIHFVCDPWKRVDYDPNNKTRLKNEHIYIYIYTVLFESTSPDPLFSRKKIHFPDSRVPSTEILDALHHFTC